MTWMSIGLPVAWVTLFLWIRWMLTPPKPETASPSPRFSRKAIWGAVWAPLVFGAVIPMVVVETVTTSGPGNLPPPAGVPLAVRILAGVLTTLGAAAPFATTILGAVAIAQIRRSQGRLYGLPLAVADVLLFPLLLLDLLILGVVYVAAHPVASVIALAGVVWIDFLIARAVWRAAAGIRADAGRETVPESRVLIWAGGIQVIGSIAAAMLVAGWIVDDNHFDAFFRSDAGRIPILVLQTLAFLTGWSAVVGGLAMRGGGKSPFSRIAAYGLLPPLTPTWLISLPLAVWALSLTAAERRNSP